MNTNFKEYAGYTISVVLFMYLAITLTKCNSNNKKHKATVKKRLELIQSQSAEKITLMPTKKFSRSLVRDDLVISDSTEIKLLSSLFLELKKWRPSNGRMPGNWEVKLEFAFQNGATAHVIVYSNDYNNLMYFPVSKSDQGPNDLYDYLTNKEIGVILEQLVDEGSRTNENQLSIHTGTF